jgi:hypothetical protein
MSHAHTNETLLSLNSENVIAQNKKVNQKKYITILLN